MLECKCKSTGHNIDTEQEATATNRNRKRSQERGSGNRQVRRIDQIRYPMTEVASLSAVPQSCRTPLQCGISVRAPGRFTHTHTHTHTNTQSAHPPPISHMWVLRKGRWASFPRRVERDLFGISKLARKLFHDRHLIQTRPLFRWISGNGVRETWLAKRSPKLYSPWQCPTGYRGVHMALHQSAHRSCLYGEKPSRKGSLLHHGTCSTLPAHSVLYFDEARFKGCRLTRTLTRLLWEAIGEQKCACRAPIEFVWLLPAPNKCTLLVYTYIYIYIHIYMHLCMLSSESKLPNTRLEFVSRLPAEPNFRGTPTAPQNKLSLNCKFRPVAIFRRKSIKQVP